MRICILADDTLKAEFLQRVIPEGTEIIWADTLKVFYSISDVNVYFDLLFSMDYDRVARLKKIQETPIFVNSVNYTLADIGGSFIRINAWPTMLQRDISELSIQDSFQENSISLLFEKLQWKYKIVPDMPGMITPRVIAMIINEAYFTLEQNVSTKDEIDIAMKLGTNYPLGPFEWSRKIGLKNIYSLLHTLSLTQKRYMPSALLKEEAGG